MTEEQIRKMICYAYWEDGEGADLFDQFIDEYSSLLKTNESQKGEIERLKGVIITLQDAHEIERLRLQSEIDEMEQQMIIDIEQDEMYRG